MPTETRKISFTPDETRAALVSFALRKGRRLPKANIEHLEVGKPPDINVTLHFSIENPADPAKVTFDHNEVYAALILHCRGAGVPVPRFGQKLLRREDDGGIALLIRLELGGRH